MHVTSLSESASKSSLDSEVKLTLEACIEMANSAIDGDLRAREILSAHRFSRAEKASEASLQRLAVRFDQLLALLNELPKLDAQEAISRVNEELTELPITPSIADHGGAGPHLHWTPSTARFDDQVMADLVMALAQELCDNGTTRFGRCGADDCEWLFYDATRNRSKRFCASGGCASRTHTAEHRARTSETS